ncbi:MAG: AAA family ATPase [Hyphomicrobiaceae bacterium]
MRILAIRGENLASLTAFDIPLATGPLEGVGLFAITGDTGSGKSTILDAMCLALYGKYPRTSAGGRERVADAGGEDLLASDPAHILRRGAASCFAETDFVGLDGHAYRARWAIRRARGKATGRLQNPEHTLSRLDGANITAKATATIAAVEERSGFTFDQFCRTVLLAQGEFDRFLLADESQRADLLEKITGTQIYTRISTRVFSETGQRKRKLENLDLLRGNIAVLDDGAREAQVAERDQKTAMFEAALADCKRIEVQLEHANRIASARKDLDDANARVRAVQVEIAAAAQNREQLRLLRAVEPMRVVSVAFEQCGRSVASAEAKRGEAASQLQTAIDARAATAARLQSAVAAAEAAEANVKRAEPDWAKAGALDVQIATARTELAGAEAAHEAASLGDAQARQTAKSHGDSLAELNQASTQAATALAACASHAPLAANLARIETAAGERTALLKRQAALHDAGKRLSVDMASLDARVKAATVASERDSAHGKQRAVQLKQKRSALAAFDLPKLEHRQEALSKLVAGLDRILAIIERRDEHQERAAQADAAVRQAEMDGQAAQARADAARQSHDANLRSRNGLQALSDLAEATLTQHANHLRSVLIDAEPCPVCGSADHPYTQHATAASELANGIRAQRVALDQAIEAAKHDLLQAETAQAGARARREAAYARGQDAQTMCEAASQQVRDATPLIVAAAHELGHAALTQALDTSPIASRIMEQRRLLTPELEHLSRQQNAGRALRNETEELQLEIDTVAARAEAERKAADDDRAALAGLTASATGNAASMESLRDQLAATLSELDPYLAIAGIASPDLDTKTVASLGRLRQLAGNYNRLEQECTQIGTALAEARTRSQTADERARAAAQAQDQALQALADRRAARDALAAQRAPMLDGEGTAVHRSRITGLEAEARRVLDAARSASATADAAFAASDTNRKASDAALETAKAQFVQASLAWTAGVAALALTVERALDLLAVPPARVSEIAAHLDRLDQAQAQANTVAALRHSELEKLLAAGTERDAAALETLRGEHEARVSQKEMLANERSQIEYKLKSDDDARGRMSALAAETDAAKADYETWNAVDDAIGASNGAKFRRFAQGVTLGHLVHLANRQLAALNPRYALRVNPTTDLSLDVVDQDMGDEIRGPRSLSGGERFLVSLALALALSGLEGRQSFVDSLFIDEGFGGLDRDTLDMAIDALESLQSHGRKVGVITHVAAMIERIPVQVRVEKRGGGRSTVVLQDNGIPLLAAKFELLPAAQ